LFLFLWSEFSVDAKEGSDFGRLLALYGMGQCLDSNFQQAWNVEVIGRNDDTKQGVHIYFEELLIPSRYVISFAAGLETGFLIQRRIGVLMFLL